MSVVPLAGIEPAATVPETIVLSIKLQGLGCYFIYNSNMENLGYVPKEVCIQAEISSLQQEITHLKDSL